MPNALTARRFMPPPVATLSEAARIWLRAARMWVMLARAHRDPKPVLAQLLGDAAPAFSTLMEAAVSAWPDAFTSFPPCAAAVSPDESTLLDLLALASEGQRAEADRRLMDLLPPSDRGRLWALASRATPPGV